MRDRTPCERGGRPAREAPDLGEHAMPTDTTFFAELKQFKSGIGNILFSNGLAIGHLTMHHGHPLTISDHLPVTVTLTTTFATLVISKGHADATKGQMLASVHGL